MPARTFVSAILAAVGLGAALVACGDEMLRAPAGDPPVDEDGPTTTRPNGGSGVDGGNQGTTGGTAGSDGAPLPDTAPLPDSPVPAAGGLDTLDVGSWNIEWFGSPQEGPTDDDLQATHVRDTVHGTKLDVWGFEEVVDGDRWKTAIRSISGWNAIVGSDDVVAGGAAYYDADEQKLAFAYDTRTIQVSSARVILTTSNYDFAGRPPLEVKVVYATPDGRSIALTFIVVHLKAGDDTDAWTRREASINALKANLDGRVQTESILVIGDWNDELARSKVKSKGSPFAALVADTTHYAFPTRVFEDNGTSTMVGAKFANDHHVLSANLAPFYIDGSAAPLRVDQAIPGYGTTTSDHYPIVSRYKP